VLATALGVVVSGGYPAVSRVARVLALLLVATTVVTVAIPDGRASGRSATANLRPAHPCPLAAAAATT
jgi:hypothetical protein